MLLFTLCPGITAAPVFPASYQPSSSPPPWSGSAAAAPRLRYIRCMTAPTPLSAAAPLLHTPGRAQRGDHRRQPPEGLHYRGRLPGSPLRRGRPPGKRPGGSAAAKRPNGSAAAKRPNSSAATKRVSFAHPLASTPSTPPPRNGPGTVFLPSAEVFARPGPAAPPTSP